MMTAFQVPGIYREKERLQPRRSVPVGVPLFLGVGQWVTNAIEQSSTTNPFVAFTRFEDFEPLWEGTDSCLKAVVRGFFANGGQLCYVLPMADNGAGTLRQRLAELESLEDIDLVCAPDLVKLETSVDDVVAHQVQILTHCELMGDRFAVLDGMRTKSQLEQQRQRLNSSYGAIYFPWLSALEASSGTEYVPPCGHVAGIYARSDAAVGVYKAPANELVEGVCSLEMTISSKDQARLNASQAKQSSINFIRQLPGRGIRVWGARTLSSDPEWRYISVRRLVITLKRWLEYHLADLVFEPNSPDLWAIAKRDVMAYLSGLWQQGALRGSEPERAFYVKCDAETNPVAVRDAGQLVVEIGVAPVEPGEFIRVRFIQSALGSTLDVV